MPNTATAKRRADNINSISVEINRQFIYKIFDGFYIVRFDVNKIDRVGMNAELDGVMTAKRPAVQRKAGATDAVEIEVRPPDINFSDTNFTCDPSEQRIFFLPSFSSCKKHLIISISQGTILGFPEKWSKLG